MSAIDKNELAAALGDAYTVDAQGDQAHILKNGLYFCFVDMQEGRIDVDLHVRWHDSAVNPDDADLAKAQEVFDCELRPDWEKHGFAVDESGELTHCIPSEEPKQPQPLYNVTACKEVASPQEAATLIGWLEFADTDAWIY